ncbi:DUF2247 family protein [Chromobacterium piscinae]|uniref:DUF2247 family protein n=1 Tax=Chromobacterium piscinae TaxID=686831 RepID=UPI001E308847|nr:DUF2247 family protein [Chromobacterium piscinae]MCD4505157.1 DUF2247 family protein [Chromobacterium piscinae]
MNLYPIPFDFIDKGIYLSWRDVEWGCENGIIGLEVPVKKAEKKVVAGGYTDLELELSFVMLEKDSANVLPLLESLCSTCKGSDSSIVRRKWLFIVLNWLWSNCNKFNDPLGEVESIYSEFGYPVEIEGFVKYMPPADGYDPSVHTQQENISRLMNNWRGYLEQEFDYFSNRCEF